MNKQQEPRLRFKGFSGAWEEKKIGEIFNVTSGTTPLRSNQNYFSNGVINWVKTTDLNNSILDKTEEKISEIALNETSLKVLPKNTLFVAMYGGFNQIGRTGLLNMEATCNQALAAILPDKSQNPFYLLTYLNYSVEYWKGIAASSRKDPNITKQDVLDFECFFPSLPEQTHLSLFFRRLDSLIVESRAVLEKSRQLKKAMLAKMFPANGEKTPKIRFKGFEGEWECRKLGDLMNVTSVKRIHQSDWTNEGVRFLRARDIVAFNKGEKIEEPLFISKEKYNEYSEISGKVKIGDLLVTGVGTIGVPYLIEDEDPLYFKDGNVIWFQNENKIGGLFFYYSFLNNFIQDFIIETAGIGTVGTYTIDTGKKTPIFLPPTKSEQTAIGNFFRQLDETIALQSAEVEKLNQLKKGLLAAMLV